jgi:hypothetical protein
MHHRTYRVEIHHKTRKAVLSPSLPSLHSSGTPPPLPPCVALLYAHCRRRCRHACNMRCKRVCAWQHVSTSCQWGRGGEGGGGDRALDGITAQSITSHLPRCPGPTTPTETLPPGTVFLDLGIRVQAFGFGHSGSGFQPSGFHDLGLTVEGLGDVTLRGWIESCHVESCYVESCYVESCYVESC